MATIDNLSIEISGSADKLSASLDRLEGVLARLATAADRVRTATENVGGGMHDAADDAEDMGDATEEAGEQAGRARINFGRFWNALRNVGTHVGGFFVNSVQRGVTALGTFVRSLGRIAFYRAIRSILKDLGQSFKDLYGYSKIYGVEFAKSMDRITTATTYMRNSFAAMIAPLVNAFAPLIDWLADKIVGLMNFINQLFAAINGQETYTVAKKVATTWESTFDSSANHAKKKIKEVKNTLLGFDEINRLNGETPSSSGNTGSSPYTPGYSTMFEEKPLEGFFASLSGIMNGMPDWVKWLFSGGALVGGFLLIHNFLPWVIGKIGEIFLMTPPEWISWLFSSTRKVAEVAVSLVRSGWETIKGWAVSFGEAVVDLAVRVKTKIADLWASIVTAWNALNPVLQVGIVIGVTAAALWAAYQLAWALAPEKMLEVEATIKTTASALWGTLQTAWGDAKNYVLGVAVSVATSAKTLFDSIQNAWGKLADASLPIAVYIATAASTLKKNIADAWGKLGDWALGVSLGLATSAAQLQSSIQSAWGNLAVWSLGVGIKLSKSAAQLKNDLVTAWNKLEIWSLGVAIKLSKTAAQLKNDIVVGWNKLEKWSISAVIKLSKSAAQLKNDLVVAWNKLEIWSISAVIKLSKTAAQLKNDLVVGWNKLEVWALSIPVKLAKTAAQLKNDLVTSWNKLEVWSLSVAVKLGLSAAQLKNNLVTEWNKLKAWSLDVAISSASKIETAVNNVWEWVKDNWKIVAAGALGIAIAIATPWSTIAAALSGLWADVMASFGGALAFSIVPTLGSIFGGGKGKAAQLNPNASYYDNSTGELVIKTSPTEVQVDATPGRGFKENNLSRKKAFELDMNDKYDVAVDLEPTWSEGLGGISGTLGLSNETVDITANAKKGWKGSYKSEVGANDTTSTITANLSKAWGKQKPLEYLDLSDLTAVIKIKLQKEKNNAVSYKIKAGGGTGKGVVAYELKRHGGVFANGQWSNIPQYANGTLNAGTIFAAGEAGPEVVGHVGGRTEVLNKSQLASAMYSAVQAAMAPAAANFAAAAQSMGVADVSFDLDTLAEMVRQGVEQAMGRQNELDRQRNEYLRQINEKDYNPEISTSSINKAQQRMNRRAGTTIVPVGT